jgi:TonB-linked SusC/RagA family outer membrane protein
MPKMLNAKQYMDVQDLIAYNEGNDKVNNWAEYIEPSRLAAYQNGTDEGTDWLEEIRTKNAPITDHALNITGGNEMSKFSLGVSYLNQKGIFGHPVESKFERTTVRMNSDHTIYKANNRDIVTFGETILYTYKTNGGIGQGNTYWNDLFNCMQAFPIVPVRNANGEYYTYNDMAYDGDQTTYPYSQGYKGMLDYDSSTPNPVADMVYNRGHNISKSHALNMTAYLKISPIQGLTFKSQFGYRLSAYNYRSYTPYYKINTTSQNLSETVSQSSGMGWSYTVDNTLDYDFKIDKNDIDVMAGQSFEKWGFGEDMSASDGSLLFTGMDYAWLSNSQTKSKGSVSGGPWSKGAIASFFGRVNWNYDETYMATAILRTDGSSNFMRGHRWGWFPSFSAGWVVSNEAFMESTKSWLDFLKLRASWGLNGNCNISPFQYLATVSFGNTAGYRFGSQTLGNYTQGAYADILPNEDVTWEKSEQLDLGFDARFLNSRLNVAFDWYKKTTKDWLLVKDILLTAGTGAPYYNGGNVENKGFELGLNWNDKIGREFNYGASVNIAYNKNKVTKINTATGVIYGASNTLFQGSSTAYAAKVGEPIGYFWGYKTAGVFQNREEIEAWKSAGKPFIDSYKNIQPGDLKFVDSNGDGKLDDSDKTKIGDPNPHWTLGTSLNCSYKGFDLAVTTYGNFGVDVIRSYRRTADSRRNNFTTEVFGYWHGEGTSNTYPRLQDGSKGTNWQTVSDIYVDNADFLKIKNVTIGYDFKKLWKSSPLQQIRCYFTVENLYTFTGYKGFDPEVGSSAGTGSDWARGIDIGCYPQPRTVMFGVNLKF